MCGINGIVSKEGQAKGLAERVANMNSFVKDRGPDGEGVSVSGNTALGHTRLAIVDAKNRKADQPMSYNGKTITFNGEIFNHGDLRKELESKGVKFDTKCDTEVLLKGYDVFKEKVLGKLNGQFAFAVHDNRNGETFLARDRTGKKPLYFSNGNGEFQFSSNPRAIARSIGFKPDLGGLASLLINGATFAAGEEPLGGSTYQGIKSLLPGEFMRVSSDGKIDRKRYYSLPINDSTQPLSEKESVRSLRERVSEAIVTRLPREVKLGIALSGGLDSSIVASVAARNTDKEVIASCIRYNADRQNEDYRHAKMVTQMHPNLRLVSADITPENFLDDLEEMVGALGVHDSIRQLAMFRNYKVLRQNGVKVALTGEGADEFNWGYWHKFPGLKLDQEACKDGGSFRKLIAGRGDFVRALIAKGKRKEIDFDGDTNGLLEIYNGFKTNDSRKKMMGVYATDFLAFLNKANDRCGMANSIESRCPFQDVNVIETCLNIPREYQIRGESEKEVLRESFKEILPAQVYRRAKAPLPAASHLDYHRQIAREFDKRIESTDSSFWKYFDRDAFSQMAKSYNGKINYLGRTYRSPDEAGAELVKWRPIGERARIIDGTGLRTNDVFKLLTAMVWYNQNMKGGARR